MQSVLIVDALEETREVLRTALEPQGVRVLAASRPQHGIMLARAHRPDLIVLDLECEGEEAEGGAASAADVLRREAPLVMLGTARRRPPHLPDGPFVAKPYHYAPLIRRIEELLAAPRPPAAAAG